MDGPNPPSAIFPFRADNRTSGLLLHVTSLPSRFGIGDLGPGAFAWVDRLQEAGQTWWQALPLGPTGYANSPYQCLSSFAGNGLLISPEFLIQDGLLAEQECQEPFASTRIDYDAVIPFKHRLLAAAWRRFRDGARPDLYPPYQQFCQERESWLEDYALFRTLKIRHGGGHYLTWPEELVRRAPAALERARKELAEEIDQVRLAQFLLSRQAGALKAYARERGIGLIGDLPFFVSPDSADVWAHPEFFLLDERGWPHVVAGVPPDYFSDRGQLWGNPGYDWEALASTGYAWCIDRIRALLAHVDLVRLDHFRGFAAAWHVPIGMPDARSGQWDPGPGAAFFNAVQKYLGGLPFIAEDLGVITPDVAELRDMFHIPGTRVLQFGFSDGNDNPHLPHNHPINAVAYTGTHDNPTTREWFEDLSEAERRRVRAYLKRPEIQMRDAAPELIRQAWSSPAGLAIAPLQDLLNLGRDARMNTPGQADGNWRWRATPNMLAAWNFRWLRELSIVSHRSGSLPAPLMEAAS